MVWWPFEIGVREDQNSFLRLGIRMGGKKTMKEGLRGHLRLVERVSKAREKIICIVCIEEAEEAKEKKIAESDSAEQL